MTGSTAALLPTPQLPPANHLVFPATAQSNLQQQASKIYLTVKVGFFIQFQKKYFRFSIFMTEVKYFVVHLVIIDFKSKKLNKG